MESQYSRPPALLQAVLVLMVAGTTCFLSVRNNQTDLLYSLTGLCFGYYFGSLNKSITKDS